MQICDLGESPELAGQVLPEHSASSAEHPITFALPREDDNRHDIFAERLTALLGSQINFSYLNFCLKVKKPMNFPFHVPLLLIFI